MVDIFWFIVHCIEIVLFVYLGFAAIYVFLFGLAGLFQYRPVQLPSYSQRKFAVLIPGYKEDAVIVEVARQATEQNYPSTLYDVVIIADSFQADTLESLRQLPIKLVVVSFEKSTKSKALNAAMAEIGDNYDVALILDADNVMEPDFIEKINMAFENEYIAVQGHRAAKNFNTNMAVLDAISEEINNSIFRKGHRVLGLSSALIGSGMAFDYGYFKEVMSEVKAVGGFDKELELRLLQAKKPIEYVPDAIVYDEKVQQSEVFANQRRRWLSAQFVYFGRYAFKGLKGLVIKGNVDFADKVYQMVQPPRVILLGIVTMITITMGLINGLAPFWMWTNLVFDFATWFIVWILVVAAFVFSVPKSFYNWRTVKALARLPGSFIVMLLSLFKLKGANKRFIHTSHGVDEENKDK